MTKLSLNLPVRYRLHLQLVKRRGLSFPKHYQAGFIEKAKNVRVGSKVSRFFRLIFEQKNIKKVLGSNLALAIVATSFVPQTLGASTEPRTEEAVIRLSQTPLMTEVSIQYPVREVKINQGFKFFHHGIDLEGTTGDEVRPIKAGKVSRVQHSRFLYGNAVLIDHGNGLSSLYAHLSKINVEEGAEVNTFTKIGEVGSTGRSTGDHLHLEIHRDGLPINPLAVLPRI